MTTNPWRTLLQIQKGIASFSPGTDRPAPSSDWIGWAVFLAIAGSVLLLGSVLL